MKLLLGDDAFDQEVRIEKEWKGLEVQKRAALEEIAIGQQHLQSLHFPAGIHTQQ